MNTHREPSFFTMLLLISFASVNAVLYTPALPALSAYFDITSEVAQQTITIFLFGYTIGQLIYGPIANRYGRLPAVFVGCIIQILSSLACAAAVRLNSFELFYWARFFAALGSGVGLKITFTLVNEFYSPKEASQKVSYLVLVFAVAPGLSISIGGVITQYFQWVTCFYFLAVYGLIVLYLSMKLPETKPELDTEAFSPKHLIEGYLNQIKVSQLIAAGFLMGGCTAFVYLFASLAPFIAMDHFGMKSAEFGFANLLPSVGMLFGGVTSAQLIKKYPILKVMSLGIPLMCLGVGLLAFGCYHDWPPLYSLFIPAMVCFMGNAMVYGNTSTVGLQATQDKAHGSAVLNFLNIGIGAMAVFSLSLHKFPPILILPMMAVLCCTLVVLNFTWLKR